MGTIVIEPEIVRAEIVQLTEERDWYRAQVRALLKLEATHRAVEAEKLKTAHETIEALREEKQRLLDAIGPLVSQGYVAWAWLGGWVQLSAGTRHFATDKLKDALRAVEKCLPQPIVSEGERTLAELLDEDGILRPHLLGLVDAARNEMVNPSGKTWQQELDELRGGQDGMGNTEG